jgi:hypothetical protein
MIKFKTFFEDNYGDIDILAKEPKKKARSLGQVTADDMNAILRHIDSLNQGGNDMIEKLIADSEFITRTGRQEINEYLRGFRSIMADRKYDIDWTAFKNHVDNRFQRSLLDDVAPSHGTLQLDKLYLPIISQFVKTNPEQFFEEVFTMSYPIGGTSVGDGEFLLGIIGNGKKGQSGDVDVVEKQPKGRIISEEGIAIEVGTAAKIIGASSRESGYKNLAREIRDIIVKYGISDERIWNEIHPRLDMYEVIGGGAPDGDRNLKVMENMLMKYSGDPPKQLEKQNSNLTRVIGGLVLYDYLAGHQDDVIMSINYGTKRYRKSHKEGSIPLYQARYAYIGHGGYDLQGTINLMISENFYNFQLDPEATRFRLGT